MAAPMSIPRFGHSLTLLADGRVLALGGISAGNFIGNAEVFDPSTGLWTDVGSSTSTRYFHTATRLPNGKVLVVGGREAFGGVSDVVELFDPATLSFTLADNAIGAAESHAAVRLDSGDVAVLNGTALWRWRSGDSRWQLIRAGQNGSVFEPPFRGVLMDSGLPLFAINGGSLIRHPLDGSAPDTLLLFPSRVVGNAVLLRRSNGAVVVGSNDRVEVLGGLAASMTYRSHYALVESPSGPMVIGGWDDQVNPLASTLIDTGGILVSGPNLNKARARASAVRLLDGRLLVCGGVDNGGMNAIADCELLGASQSFDDLALEPLYQELQPGVFQISLRVRHLGNNGASGVSLSVLPESGLRTLSATPSQGSYSAGNWSAGALSTGAQATLVLNVDFDPSTGSDQLTLSADLTATSGNQDSSNDQARFTLLRELPNLSVTQTAVQAGTQIVYTLRVSHDGQVARPFSAVTIQGQLSPGQTLVQAVPAGGSFDPATLRWTLGALDVGASQELRLVTDVDTPDQAGLYDLASALLQSTPGDANPGDNGAQTEVEYQAVAQPASIGGRIWEDRNGNGIQDVEDGPVTQVPVYLLATGTLIASQTSDLQGRYRFDGLQAGPYTIEVGVLPNQSDGSAWLPTAQGIGGDATRDSDIDPTRISSQRDDRLQYAANVTVAEGEARLDIDAGLHHGLQLSGRVWRETTERGIENPQEPGLAGERIELYIDGSKRAETLTDANGWWQLRGVGCACNRTTLDVELRVADLGGRAVSPRQVTTNDQIDNDFSLGGSAGQRWAELRLPDSAPTAQRSELDAGLFASRVRGIAWEDLNGDGLRDPGEPPLAGIRFGLRDANGTPRYVQSGSDGRYAFEDIAPGDYQLAVFSALSDLAPSLPSRWLQGSDPTLDSDFSAQRPVPTAEAPGGERGFFAEQTPPLQTIDWYDTLDAGLHRGTLLRGKVWRDGTPLGTREDGEPGLPGHVVSVRLEGSTSPLAQAITDANGDYELRAHCLCNQPTNALLSIDFDSVFAAVPSGLGSDPTRDSNFDLVSEGRLETAPFALRPDRPRASVDAGLNPERARITVSAWHDLDFDGVRGPFDPDRNGGGEWLLFRSGVVLPLARAPVTATHSFVVSDPGDYRLAWEGAACHEFALAPPTGTAPGGGDNDFVGDTQYDGVTGWFPVTLGEHVADINFSTTERSGLILRTQLFPGNAITPAYTFHQPDAGAPQIVGPFAQLSNGDMLFDGRARVPSVIKIPPIAGRVLLGATAGHPEVDPPNWRTHPVLPDPGCNVFPAEASLYLNYRVIEFVAMLPQSVGQASANQGTNMTTAGAPASIKRLEDYWAELEVMAGSVTSTRELYLSEYVPGDQQAAKTTNPPGWQPVGMGMLFGALDGGDLLLSQDAHAAFVASGRFDGVVSLRVFDPVTQRWQPFEQACPGRRQAVSAGATRFEFSACRAGWYALFEPGVLFNDGFETGGYQPLRSSSWRTSGHLEFRQSRYPIAGKQTCRYRFPGLNDGAMNTRSE
ncbi:SdrD B-like domain-containing protein [Pseudomarimonas arenosa]|uniref:DUF11 domain-containing protein n=1 Tax=Pseudomarimonas arenosa TaxID=2774145 RepID=A0AAW3ZMP8_9GAMM|nr:SdrD B-like domain-containing protein [Pseudomarimonas arenosa]MBD8526467.1 hypothetical protein [Pseudomarimonas arenosa]